MMEELIKIHWFYSAIKKSDISYLGKLMEIEIFTLIKVRQHKKGFLWRKWIGGVGTGETVGDEYAQSTLTKNVMKHYFALWIYIN